jgi:hypothetical protein
MTGCIRINLPDPLNLHSILAQFGIPDDGDYRWIADWAWQWIQSVQVIKPLFIGA